MKKELSDEQFNRLMQTMLTDASLPDPEIDKIADSPAIWWALKRDIENGKAAALPWPPANWSWRAAMFGVPSLTAVAVILSVFVWRTSDPVLHDVAALEGPKPPVLRSVEPSVLAEAEPPIPAPRSNIQTVERAVVKKVTRKAAIRTDRTIRATPKLQEIKTEFIALSFAINPDSGQIVRVKVPSSMMVTLGLVSTVEKPTDLIDAEVVVGDDGLTRAIRFIR